MSSHSILLNPDSRYKVNEKIQFTQQQEILLFLYILLIFFNLFYFKYDNGSPVKASARYSPQTSAAANIPSLPTNDALSFELRMEFII